MFGKKKNNQISVKSSNYNTIAFIEKLLSDVTKWKVFTFLFVFIAMFFALKETAFKKVAHGGKKFVAILEIDTIIFTEKHRSKVLNELQKNKNLTAVLLKINSPGGTITGSEILYNEIKRLSTKVPVYALIYDLGASGAYMAALGATKIFAHKTSLTGSIGVLMQSLDASELANKIGAKVKTYRSGTFKGQPDTFEKDTPQIAKYMQTAIMESHAFFEQLVMKERKISASNIKNIANGKIFIGYKALQLKLVDGITTEATLKSSIRKQFGKNIKFREISLKEKDNQSFISHLIDELLSNNKENSSKAQILAIMK